MARGRGVVLSGIELSQCFLYVGLCGLDNDCAFLSAALMTISSLVFRRFRAVDSAVVRLRLRMVLKFRIPKRH